MPGFCHLVRAAAAGYNRRRSWARRWVRLATGGHPMASDGEGEAEGEGSVTHWIGDLKSGGDSAAQHLWERYFQRLVRLARKKLQSDRRPRTAEDEEDAALSAFDSFCRGVDRGRFPRLTDRDDLWRLLVVLTLRK